MNKVKRIFLLPWFPLLSISATRRLCRFVEKLNSKEQFDLVISTYAPMDTVIAGLKLKKKTNNGVNFCLYNLDTFTNFGKSKKLIVFLKLFFGPIREKQVFFQSDLILNMKCHEEHHNAPQYDIYREKMRIVDIPLLDNKKNIALTVKKESNSIQMLFTGSIYPTRNPKIACECISGLKHERVRAKFYMRGSLYNMMREYQEKTSGRITVHGFIPPNELEQVIEDSDILLSIGNDNSELIPSKTFNYIATGKPIIHFYNGYSKETDTVIAYLERYGNALFIDNLEDLSVNINKIDEFLDSNLGRVVDPSVLQEKFKENYPEYTTETIIEYFNGE